MSHEKFSLLKLFTVILGWQCWETRLHGFVHQCTYIEVISKQQFEAGYTFKAGENFKIVY